VVGVVSPRDISTAMTAADLRHAQPYPLLGADLTVGATEAPPPPRRL
jgi:hypothetical protein